MGNVLTRQHTIDSSVTIEVSYEDALKIAHDARSFLLLDDTLVDGSIAQDANDPSVWKISERIGLPLLPEVKISARYSTSPDGCRWLADAALGVKTVTVMTLQRADEHVKGDAIVWTEVATLTAPWYSYSFAVGPFSRKRVTRFATTLPQRLPELIKAGSHDG